VALPAEVLSGIDMTSIVAALSRGLAESRSVAFPPMPATITESITCEIATGAAVVTRIEVRTVRTVIPLAMGGEAVPWPQINQPVPGSGPEPTSYSLTDSRAASHRATDLIESIRRALRVDDIPEARAEGAKLEELLETAIQDQISSEILIEGYLLLCDVEFAIFQQQEHQSDAQLTRAHHYLERAKNVPSP
jgi:hypothetical protein